MVLQTASEVPQFDTRGRQPFFKGADTDNYNYNNDYNQNYGNEEYQPSYDQPATQEGAGEPLAEAPAEVQEPAQIDSNTGAEPDSPAVDVDLSGAATTSGP